MATTPVDTLYDGSASSRSRFRATRSRRRTGPGCTHSATLAALLARGFGSRRRRGARLRSRPARSPRPRRDRRRGRSCRRVRPGGAAKLSELGEFGLLAELERQGLVLRDRGRRGATLGRARGHAGRARRGRALPGSTGLVARSRLSRGGSQPQRPRRVGRRARGPDRHARAAGPTPTSTTCSSSTRASPRRACR